MSPLCGFDKSGLGMEHPVYVSALGSTQLYPSSPCISRILGFVVSSLLGFVRPMWYLTPALVLIGRIGVIALWYFRAW